MTAQASPRRSLTIRGYLTLTSHSHQAAPTSDETGVTSHMKTPVLAGGKLIPDVPFITANSVRALIRRACGNVLFDQIKKMHDQVPRNVYLSVQRGGFARTGMLAGGASYQQLIAAKDHMFSGLFGGGAFMYPSCVRMESSLIPMITTLKDLFPDRY